MAGMDHYCAYFDLKPGERDMALVAAVTAFMDQLKADGLIEGWNLRRRKFGFGPKELGEFHLDIATRDLAQLDTAFRHVARRAEPTESAHFDLNSKVTNLTFALYRDFPDAIRHQGEEKF
jgi:hypothetical protein